MNSTFPQNPSFVARMYRNGIIGVKLNVSTDQRSFVLNQVSGIIVYYQYRNIYNQYSTKTIDDNCWKMVRVVKSFRVWQQEFCCLQTLNDIDNWIWFEIEPCQNKIYINKKIKNVQNHHQLEIDTITNYIAIKIEYITKKNKYNSSTSTRKQSPIVWLSIMAHFGIDNNYKINSTNHNWILDDKCSSNDASDEDDYGEYDDDTLDELHNDRKNSHQCEWITHELNRKNVEIILNRWFRQSFNLRKNESLNNTTKLIFPKDIRAHMLKFVPGKDGNLHLHSQRLGKARRNACRHNQSYYDTRTITLLSDYMYEFDSILIEKDGIITVEPFNWRKQIGGRLLVTSLSNIEVYGTITVNGCGYSNGSGHDTSKSKQLTVVETIKDKFNGTASGSKMLTSNVLRKLNSIDNIKSILGIGCGYSNIAGGGAGYGTKGISYPVNVAMPTTAIATTKTAAVTATMESNYHSKNKYKGKHKYKNKNKNKNKNRNKNKSKNKNNKNESDNTDISADVDSSSSCCSCSNVDKYFGQTYGNAKIDILYLGSAGGNGLLGKNNIQYGSNGGGAIYLSCNNGYFKNEGNITANGKNCSRYWSGGGSGGSVKIECKQYVSSKIGQITVQGGDSRCYTFSNEQEQNRIFDTRLWLVPNDQKWQNLKDCSEIENFQNNKYGNGGIGRIYVNVNNGKQQLFNNNQAKLQT